MHFLPREGYLDANELAVENLRHSITLKALSFHHMAPASRKRQASRHANTGTVIKKNIIANSSIMLNNNTTIFVTEIGFTVHLSRAADMKQARETR